MKLVGFVHGRRRAAYGLPDGFTSIALPVLDARSRDDRVEQFTHLTRGLDGPPDPGTAAALIAADDDVTLDLLARVVGAGDGTWLPAAPPLTPSAL